MSRGTIILVLGLLLYSSFPAAGEVYVAFTDREFGFWAVRSYNINHTLNYTSRTLNIDTGDSIEWMNMDNEGDRITIVSDNVLWEGGKTLEGIGSKFRFTFNSSGIFRFHINENTRARLNASNYSENVTSTTLTYEDDDGQIHTITVSRSNRDKLKDVISTDRYNYQQMTIRVTGPTIGNETYPVNIARQTSSPFTTTIRPAIRVNASPTPVVPESLMQSAAEAAVPKPLESYQEFTIYAVLRRWMEIIING